MNEQYQPPTDAESSGCAYSTSTVALVIAATLVLGPFVALHYPQLQFSPVWQWLLVVLTIFGTSANALGLQFHGAAISLQLRAEQSRAIKVRARIATAMLGFALLGWYFIVAHEVVTSNWTEPRALASLIFALNIALTAHHYFAITTKGGR